MQIIEYFSCDDKKHWLDEIYNSPWEGAKVLYKLISENKLKEDLGETAQVFILSDDKMLVSFCTFAPYDDVKPTVFTPWIGFVYTNPQYRGKKCAGILLRHAESLAEKSNYKHVFISTPHVGLYEKYGYEFLFITNDTEGNETRVYRKRIV